VASYLAPISRSVNL